MKRDVGMRTVRSIDRNKSFDGNINTGNMWGIYGR
jgi:hypothetical protein